MEGYTSGRAFLNGERLNAAELIEQFRSFHSFADFVLVLQKLNGYYAIISDTDDQIYAAVDHARSIPLFYDVSGHRLISDNARWIQNQLRVQEYDPIAESEFTLTRYVTR